MKLAILGGSFNPIHLGHLFLADAVLSSLQYDRVIMIPAYRSPFKLAAKGMEETAKDRLDMLAASIAGDPRLTFDDCEIRREGVSYTVDTLKDIINRYLPDGKPALIIGDDLAGEFLKWHNSDVILELADIVIARRTYSQEINFPFPNKQITNDVMEISSAMVRQRIGEGKDWRCLVPAAARAIIEDRCLYGFCGNMDHNAVKQETIMGIEAAVRENVGTGRFLHSRNTALLAWDLCRRFGLNPDMGYLAGIVHDLGKPLGDKKLLELVKSDGRGISKLEKEKPSLLHGRAAAVLLRERFCINNKDVLEAVAFHTEGNTDMGPLAKVVYIADKLEVSREKADPVLRKICLEETDLDNMFFTVLNDTVSWLRSRKLELSADTFRLLEKMKEKHH